MTAQRNPSNKLRNGMAIPLLASAWNGPNSSCAQLHFLRAPNNPKMANLAALLSCSAQPPALIGRLGLCVVWERMDSIFRSHPDGGELRAKQSNYGKLHGPRAQCVCLPLAAARQMTRNRISIISSHIAARAVAEKQLPPGPIWAGAMLSLGPPLFLVP